jgi:DNA invertase Pin-like site-specific DNA recombinase
VTELGQETAHLLRCAIYTRKSTEEGLEQAFNTLQAQREAAEAYVLSQRQAGWVAVGEHYDDGGFSGASLERPAMQRLLAAIDAGSVDCVVVYKVDRLSRSLLDFARLMERFDRRKVSFVSVTQEFNTTTSLGRLTLNILLSFAQFEREIISERTRDKLSAARRKGKWIGGWPVMGYNVDSKGGRLIVNAKEATQVQEIYRIAAESETLEAALRAIQAGGFRTKAWTSRAGRRHVARPFTRMTLRLMLSNVLYTGVVKHKGTIYPGEHERVVEQAVWEQVNTNLMLRSVHQRGRIHRRQEVPLSGLLYCGGCESALSLSYTTKQSRKYRYYCCPAARGKGNSCSQGPVAAPDLEASILEKLQPVLGSGLNWGAIRESIQRIEYEWMSHRVTVGLKDGTRMEYEMTMPNRPGANGGEREADGGRVPRVSRLMALSVKFERLIREGEIRNHRAIAEAGQICRARLSQVMRLTDLAPSIQEELLFLPKTIAGADRITEKALRKIACSLDWDWQKKQFVALKAGGTGSQSTGAANKRSRRATDLPSSTP